MLEVCVCSRKTLRATISITLLLLLIRKRKVSIDSGSWLDLLKMKLENMITRFKNLMLSNLVVSDLELKISNAIRSQ